MDKWYKNIYRRNLVDMHINDDKKIYLSKFNAKDYFKYLKEAKIDSPMIYLQSHTGLCNFKTSVSKTHNFFINHPNEIKKLINLCKDNGMKVVGYYSLIFNNQAVNDHHSWEMIDKDGHTWRDHGQRYGLACPNNKEYRKFVTKQIEEIAKEFPNLDALFFDMPYWEVLCHCSSCKERFYLEKGKEIPNDLDWDDKTWNEFIKSRQEWMAEFASFVKKETNRIMPSVTVEFNFAAVIGCDYLAGSTEGINEQCEFTGGDLYGDLYNHSFTAKYYRSISKNQPFEYMTCRCNKTLREHTINKSEETLLAEIMLTTLHGGASLIIDAINPDGTLDHRVAKRLGRVFENEIKYEKYLPFGKPLEEVGVLFDSRTQFKYHNRQDNKHLCIQLSKTLIENHIPYTIIGHGKVNELNRFKMLFIPGLIHLDEDEIKEIKNYVNSGGLLYLSGDSNSSLLNLFFEGRIEGETNQDSPYKPIYRGYDEVKAYACPTRDDYKKYFGMFNRKYPLPATFKLPILKAIKGDVCAKIVLPYTDPDNYNEFASIHSNPPGKVSKYSAIVENTFGKGKVIYSCLPIEGDDRCNYKDILSKIIKNNIASLFNIETSKYVEALIFENDKGYIINLFDLNFANDDVSRAYKITLPDSNFEAKELIKGKRISIKNGVVFGCFRNYLSIILKRK
ncbi:MAG TPA: hypothetical protein DD377_03435 [Firmicutes bacterium]|nr:hypothetical protein [Bacillota bacterium]